MGTATIGRRSLQIGVAVCVLTLVTACGNGSSPKNQALPKGHSSPATAPEAAGLFPASLVNKAVHDGTPKRGGSLTWGLESDILDVSPNQSPIQPADVQMATAVFAPLIVWGG